MSKRVVEVLLREDVKGLGMIGDVVRVAAGYSRNYLLPYSLATPATEDAKRQITRRAARASADRALRASEVAAAVARLSELVVTTAEKADEAGNLYGSVSAGQIATLISASGTPIDEKQVRLESPIKKTGEHSVLIHVFGDQETTITVKVDAQA
ncbi:MAG: large subunit ribosomal protein L9 [Planctomycetota bacterium]|jgi:large subunit ribosomal protein L9